MSKTSSGKKLCFIHVPKCGGVSLNEGIKRSLGFSRFSPYSARIKASSTKWEAIAAGMDILEYRENILVEKLKSKRIRYLRGHVRCSSEVRQQFEKDWNFITILRHPVKRWISEYFYNRYKKSNHNKITQPIEEYMDSKAGLEASCVLTRYFANGKEQNPTDAVKKAKTNLESFKLVGITELVPIFQMEYEQIFGVSLSLTHKNTNPISKNEIDKTLSPKLLNQIENICKPDIEIYEHFFQMKSRINLI